MSASVFVTCPLPAAVLAKLEAETTVDVYAGERPMPPAALRAAVGGANALVCLVNDPIDRSVIDAAPRLNVIANIGVGYDNVDAAYARSRGIVVTNTPDVLTDAVADGTWAMILAVTRRIAEGDRLVRRGAWRRWEFDMLLGPALGGKQLGIVGFGRIGRAVAARAAAFGMHVAYVSRSTAASPAAEPMSFDRLLNSSDVVSLHVPLTAETHHLIDKRALARMKRSAFLINTTRGSVVDEAALAWALQQHLIAGAAIDVYEHEPDVHPDLLALENILLTPHIASATTEARTAMADLAVANVLAVIAGQPPLTPVP